jgi:hypothetical protein
VIVTVPPEKLASPPPSDPPTVWLFPEIVLSAMVTVPPVL